MLYRTQFESSSRKVHLRAQLLVIVVRCVVQFEITSSEPFFLDIPSTQHFHYEAFHALHKSICHYVKTILQSEPTFESFVFLLLICGANLLNRRCGWGFFSFSSALLFCFMQVVRFSFYSSMHIFNVFKFKIVHLTTSTSKSMLQVSKVKVKRFRSSSRFEVLLLLVLVLL
jgi:hypothetical protein